jgi:alpha-tubulin suppressor-like RCC1 family protein
LHTAIVSTSRQLFTFGDGTFGVLGHGNIQSVYQPKEVEYLKGSWVISVTCGSWHTAAIIKIMADRPRFNAVGGNLYTWGDGANGMLGHADHERKLVPRCVAHLVDNSFVQLCCRRMMTVALTNQGNVYTLGERV